MKQKFILHNRVNTDIQIGDVVKLQDTVSATLVEHEHGPFYLSNAYPELTGSEALLSNFYATVIQTGQNGYGTEGISETDVYVQDAVIELVGAFGKVCRLRICSDHLYVPAQSNKPEIPVEQKLGDSINILVLSETPVSKEMEEFIKDFFQTIL